MNGFESRFETEPSDDETPTTMVTFGVMRGLVALTGVVLGLTSCVTRLDNLEGEDDVTEPERTTENVVVATETEGQADAAPTTGTVEQVSIDPSNAPIPAVPDCAGGSSLNSDGFCVPMTRCAPGTFVSESAGERVCSPCASGQFSNDYDAERCETWRDCQAGDFVAEPGTAMSDRQCEACPENETTTSTNAGVCTGAADCLAGTFKRDGECVDCSAGSYCSGKTESETPCDGESWDDDSDPATPCIVKTTCAPGQSVSDEGSTLQDRACIFCDEQTFSTEDNAASCSPWSTCDAGTFVSLQGTPSSDRACTPCDAETFSSEPDQASCQAWTICAAPAQFETSAPTLTEDRQCADCTGGFTTSEDNSSTCDVDPPPNLVTNYDFEQNSTGWESWIGTVSVSTARAYTGTRSLLVTGSSTGPAATVLDGAQAGATYNVSFWVDVGKVSTAQVNLTKEVTCNGATTYEWLVDSPEVTAGVWTQLAGAFTIASNCSSPKVKVYAEGSGTNVDLYVDNVSITLAP